MAKRKSKATKKNSKADDEFFADMIADSRPSGQRCGICKGPPRALELTNKWIEMGRPGTRAAMVRALRRECGDGISDSSFRHHTTNCPAAPHNGKNT